MSNNRQYYPALRGRLGDWAFYSALMTLSQVSSKVRYAKEIHNSERLSELIQRELDDSVRAGQIGEYLLKNSDRFFNSLVIAIYEGDPEWHEFANLKSVSGDIDLSDLNYQSRYSVGYLSLSGSEKLFALDGQHRIAGIRNALTKSAKLGSEEVSVIFVAHHAGKSGLKRTRKLFTTLNKTAKPVSKSEIIALDEADAMAITARQLVEHDQRFRDDRIDILRKQANLPPGDSTHITTLVNLYDILEILFTKSREGTDAGALKRMRPSDAELKKLSEFATKYFDNLCKCFSPLKSCLNATKPTTWIKKYRSPAGGHVLFRPVGLLIFAELTAAIMRIDKCSLDKSIEKLKGLPTDLSEYPYEGILWDKKRRKLNVGARAIIRDLLLYSLDYIKDSKKVKNLHTRYARYKGVTPENIKLPPPKRRRR